MSPRAPALVDPRTKSPRYMQVYTALREWILQGRYDPGQKLESEGDLCEMFGVSRITTRKAIDFLVAEGLIHRVQGKGTYVADELPEPPPRADMQARIDKLRKLAQSSRLENIDIEEITADDGVCRDLDRPPGCRVLKISYVRLLDDAPVGYSETTIPLDLGVEISDGDLQSGTPISILEDRGVAIGGADHLIGATLADSKLASLLETTVGSPLLRVKIVVFDKSGRPVDRLVAHYRADRYEHHVSLGRTPD